MAKKPKTTRKRSKKTGTTKKPSGGKSKSTRKVSTRKKSTKKTAKKKAVPAKHEVEWAKPRKGDWDFDPAKHPAYANPDRDWVHIETDEQYRLVADCIVKNIDLRIHNRDVINYKRRLTNLVIHNLPRLILFIQSHPDAVLAVATKPDSSGRINFDCTTNSVGAKVDLAVTRLSIENCILLEFESTPDNLSILEIQIVIDCLCSFFISCHFSQTRFIASASFLDIHFISETSFAESTFASRGSFTNSIFEGPAIFDEAVFSKECNYVWAKFYDLVTFHSTKFYEITLFWDTHFYSKAIFTGSYFANETLFGDADFYGNVEFDFITIQHKLTFGGQGIHDAVFYERSRLILSGLILRPGASIELSSKQLLRERNPDRLFYHWTHCDRIRSRQHRIWLDWLGQYIYLVTIPLLENTIEEIDKLFGQHYSLGLGITSSYNLIHGEGTRQPRKNPIDEHPAPSSLEKAAATYNTLRDVFRNQPSTDLQEDICTIRHQDLVRKTWDDGTLLAKARIFFHWLVMRNMLGYLIVPTRIVVTGVSLILFCAIIYAVFASDTLIISSIEQTPPWEQSRFERLKFGLYFSLTTFVTLGYGDYAPTGWFKLLTGLEAFLGVALLALFTVAWGRKMIR